MASRWHKRTAVVVGVVAVVCAALVVGKVAMDVIAQARKERHLIGTWRSVLEPSVEKIIARRTILKLRDDGTVVVRTKNNRGAGSFELSDDQIALKLYAEDAFEVTESAWNWSFDEEGLLVLERLNTTEAATIRWERVPPDDSESAK